jgi:trehalose-phosphatase
MDRDNPKLYPGVVEPLQQIVGSRTTRVAFISGRSARDLSDILHRYSLDCEIWGVHGRERRLADGRYVCLQDFYQAAKLSQAAWSLLEREGIQGLAERKTTSVAVHWRGFAPEMQKDVRMAALTAFSACRSQFDCRILEFDHGIELLLGKRDKGDVVRTILKEAPLGTPIAYLGDDWTDEDAFVALRDAGLTVLVRPDYRPTSAEMWIKPPGALVDFLKRWLASCGGEA